MARPLAPGTVVTVVAPDSQMHGEWGVVAMALSDDSYLVSPWGGDTALEFDRAELRPRRSAPGEGPQA